MSNKDNGKRLIAVVEELKNENKIIHNTLKRLQIRIKIMEQLLEKLYEGIDLSETETKSYIINLKTNSSENSKSETQTEVPAHPEPFIDVTAAATAVKNSKFSVEQKTFDDEAEFEVFNINDDKTFDKSKTLAPNSVSNEQVVVEKEQGSSVAIFEVRLVKTQSASESLSDGVSSLTKEKKAIEESSNKTEPLTEHKDEFPNIVDQAPLAVEKTLPKESEKSEKILTNAERDITRRKPHSRQAELKLIKDMYFNNDEAELLEKNLFWKKSFTDAEIII